MKKTNLFFSLTIAFAFLLFAGKVFAAPPIQADNLSVSISNAFPSPLSLLSGAPNQLVGAFQVTASASSPVSINSLSFAATKNAIGDNFKNLSIFSNRTQLGPVQPVFASNGYYTFNLSSPLIIPAESFITITAYLDASSELTSSNFIANNQSLISLNAITGSWLTDGSFVSPISPVEGQIVNLKSAQPLAVNPQSLDFNTTLGSDLPQIKYIYITPPSLENSWTAQIIGNSIPGLYLSFGNITAISGQILKGSGTGPLQVGIAGLLSIGNYSGNVIINSGGQTKIVPLSLTVTGETSATLSISLAPNTPASQTVIPGGKGFVFLAVKLTAGNSSDVTVSQINFGVSGGAGPYLTNLRMVKSDQQNFMPDFMPDVSNPLLFKPNLFIAKGTTQTLWLIGDVSPNAPVGSQFLYALASSNVTLAGKNAGSGVTGSAWPSGYTHTVIAAPTTLSISVVSPAENDQWTIGESKIITWSAPSSVSAVDITLSTYYPPCSGICPYYAIQQRTIAKQLPNTGNYKWLVGTDNTGSPISGGKYVITVSSSVNAGVNGISPAFVILPSNTTSTFTVTSSGALTGTVGQPLASIRFEAPTGSFLTFPGYHFSITSGQLPPGVTLQDATISCLAKPPYPCDPVPTAEANLIGIPTQAGKYNFTVLAYDGKDRKGYGSFTLVISSGQTEQVAYLNQPFTLKKAGLAVKLSETNISLQYVGVSLPACASVSPTCDGFVYTVRVTVPGCAGCGAPDTASDLLFRPTVSDPAPILQAFGYKIQFQSALNETISLIVSSSTNVLYHPAVRVDGDPTVYFITPDGHKRPVLNPKILFSYGFTFDDVVLISQEQLDDYDDTEYIRQASDYRVYKINNGIKQYVSLGAGRRLGINRNSAVSVNKVEFLAYRTSSTIR